MSATVEVIWADLVKAGPEESKNNNGVTLTMNKAAEYASYASWNLKNWGKFQEYTNQIGEDEAYQK